MTVKDIIETSAVFLGREDIISYLKGDDISLSNEDAEKEISILVRCVNIVLNELATEFVPLKTIETVRCNNGQILYSSLLQNPLEILKVFDINGKELDFSLNQLFIKTNSNAVQVEYTYIPLPLNLSSECVYAENEVPARIVAYGVAEKACLFEGRFDEAEIWAKKFKESASTISLPKNAVIKGRWWR